MQITNRVVSPAMPVRELHGRPAEREPEQLMTETNPEDRNAPVREFADGGNGVAHRGWIAGTVGEKYPVRLELAYPGRRCRGRHHRHAAAVLVEQPHDVALHPEIEGDDMVRRIGAIGDVLLRDRGPRREIE